MSRLLISRVIFLFVLIAVFSQPMFAARFVIQDVKGFVYGRLLLDPAARGAVGVRQEIQPDDGTVFLCVQVVVRAHFEDGEDDRASLAVKDIELRRADRVVSLMGMADRLGEMKSSWARDIRFDRGVREKRSVILVYPLTVEGEKVAISLGKQRMAVDSSVVGPAFDALRDFTVKVEGVKKLDSLSRTIGGVQGRPTRTIVSHAAGGRFISVDFIIEPSVGFNGVDELPVLVSDDLVLLDSRGGLTGAIGYREGGKWVFGGRRIDPGVRTEFTAVFRIADGVKVLTAQYLYEPVGEVRVGAAGGDSEK